MNEKKIAGKVALDIGRGIRIANDIMIAEAIMNTILGSKRAATKLSQLTAGFRDEISGGGGDEGDGERKLSFWDDVASSTRKALRLSSVQVLGKRIVDMWAEDIADIIIYGKSVQPRFQQKTVELILKSGVDTAQLGRDMTTALHRNLKGSFEMVYFQ